MRTGRIGAPWNPLRTTSQQPPQRGASTTRTATRASRANWRRCPRCSPSIAASCTAPATRCATECAELLVYATRRLDRCVFGDDKPTCAKCTVHCYSADKREEVRAVMRFAGPRMIWRHPVLAVRHVLDGRRPAPSLPVRPK